ncbi:MAG: hypothetical protein ABFD81_06025 [Syntrophaceae bacterium]
MSHAKIKLIAIGLAAAFIGLSQLSESRKRFLKELLRQTPYLIPRYFV